MVGVFSEGAFGFWWGGPTNLYGFPLHNRHLKLTDMNNNATDLPSLHFSTSPLPSQWYMEKEFNQSKNKIKIAILH